MDKVLALLPRRLQEQFALLPDILGERAEELRIRIGRPLEMTAAGESYFLPYLATEEDAQQLLNHLSQYSLYMVEEELKRGYITISGGHRVGLAGKVILENGMVKAIREVSSFNIRIARQRIGAAEPLAPALYDRRWCHTLIIGAPQSGKTTLLRDIARIISSGCDRVGAEPRKVGIVDERSEIAGCVHGVPQLDFGPRIDILDGCPKAEGMMMLIRSMSPDVLVVDEIGRAEDVEAVLEAVNSGITLVISTHGQSLQEVRKRPIVARLLELNVFERYIELGREGSERSYRVLDSSGSRLTGEA